MKMWLTAFVIVAAMTSTLAYNIGDIVASTTKNLDTREWVPYGYLTQSMKNPATRWYTLAEIAARLNIPLAVKRSNGEITVASFDDITIAAPSIVGLRLKVGKRGEEWLYKTVAIDRIKETEIDSAVLFVGIGQADDDAIDYLKRNFDWDGVIPSKS
jgi:hypothetical protein